MSQAPSSKPKAVAVVAVRAKTPSESETTSTPKKVTEAPSVESDPAKAVIAQPVTLKTVDAKTVSAVAVSAKSISARAVVAETVSATAISVEPVPAKSSVPTPVATGHTDTLRAETEEGEEEPEVSGIRLLLRTTPAWLFSMMFHALGLVVLSSLSLANLGAEKEPYALNAVVSEVTEVEMLSELDEALEDNLPQSEAIAAEEFQAADVLGGFSVSMDVESLDMALPESSMPEIGSLLGAADVAGDMADGLKAASFFGAKSKGRKFVFVVDNSNSMTNGRLETALSELMATVDGFGPKESFYIIFFSDTAYGMFHPRPAKGLIPATPRNKERLRTWLYSVQMCLKTKGEEAVRMAVSLNPDVIYILGDGAFTDNTQKILTAPHNRIIPINTLGMEVNDKGASQLKSIAAANNGTYRLVSASKEAKASAKKKPIPRNKFRGPVWGISLPGKKN